jgi:hypothetical protein
VKLWAGPEVDEIWKAIKPDETILDANWHHATTMSSVGEKREITREQLRLRSRPPYSDKTPQQWIAMLGPAIREPLAA